MSVGGMAKHKSHLQRFKGSPSGYRSRISVLCLHWRTRASRLTFQGNNSNSVEVFARGLSEGALTGTREIPLRHWKPPIRWAAVCQEGVLQCVVGGLSG